jgi:hypothetical protein
MYFMLNCRCFRGEERSRRGDERSCRGEEYRLVGYRLAHSRELAVEFCGSLSTYARGEGNFSERCSLKDLE